ncbi:hypothetical protein FALBO_6497 [Fusarium albosuccineum]|uniref:MYND-type domain-containing protein n=1 Tax=Fusarium albosuccineum TaxID=1237068 RepID=A0A8H4LBK4_9HYPO|nr:hypothetical protein FALBO_6497 [Fusarium albosuccineum]
MPPQRFPCANNGADKACNKAGRFACKNCMVVAYCGPECQKEHWSTHKQDCRSFYMKKHWQPGWVLECRRPEFINEEKSTPVGGRQYLWGNTPAIDVLQLEKNEGKRYKKDLSLLFAASGDLRNVVKTLACLPEAYKQTINITINDWDLDVVARNVMLILIALTVNDAKEAADKMTHLWYSASIRQSDLDYLVTKIRPFIAQVCAHIGAKPEGTPLAKTWTFGSRRVRLVLKKGSWMSLLRRFEVPGTLTLQQARDIRVAVTLASGAQQDFRERHYLVRPPAHRICEEKYRADGLMLPFGASREPFTIPNPQVQGCTRSHAHVADTIRRTIYHKAPHWPGREMDDPLAGWEATEVMKTNSGAASSDLYGKMYYHIQDVFKKFHHRIRNQDVTFQLYNVNAEILPKTLKKERFARIDASTFVSNIADKDYLGFQKTLETLSPLLQQQAQNPHATMLMLFINAVGDTMVASDQFDEVQKAAATAHKYLPHPQEPPFEYGAEFIRFIVAGRLFRNFDMYFNRYMEANRFMFNGFCSTMIMKDEHTIVDQWPHRLKLKVGEEGAQEEFNIRVESMQSGDERYVEWKSLK